MQNPRKKQQEQNLLIALKALLTDGKVSTQEEIRAALHKQGFEVNQSKVSRLLRKIGAIKASNDQNQIVYSLLHEPAPLSTHSPLAQLIIDITANENLIVIRTNPGSASLIGRLLDHHQRELVILGTVAGDDTIFVAPKTTKQITQCKQSIENLLSRFK